MGFRDAIKTGGGFLNGVDGVITENEFSAIAPTEKKAGDWIYWVVSILVDGAKDAITQHLFFGGVEDYEISKDGSSVSAREGNVSIGGKTPFGKMVSSMLDNGFDEGELPDLNAGEDLTMEAVNDRRFRFVQIVDVEATEKLGKRQDKKNKKKSYDRTNTVVSKVYDADEAPAKGAKSSGKGETAAKGKKSKVNPLTDEAKDILTDLLDAKGDFPRATLSRHLTKALLKNDNRDDLRDLIMSDDFLALQDGWDMADDKSETLSKS